MLYGYLESFPPFANGTIHPPQNQVQVSIHVVALSIALYSMFDERHALSCFSAERAVSDVTRSRRPMASAARAIAGQATDDDVEDGDDAVDDGHDDGAC